jgi:hypothetical protein
VDHFDGCTGPTTGLLWEFELLEASCLPEEVVILLPMKRLALPGTRIPDGPNHLAGGKTARGDTVSRSVADR